MRIWANSGIRSGSDCWVRYGSNNSGQNGGTNDDKDKDCNYLGSGDYSPEKAALYRFLAGIFQFGRERSATRHASAVFRNLSVRSHAVLADAGSYTSGRASFMKAWCAS